MGHRIVVFSGIYCGKNNRRADISIKLLRPLAFACLLVFSINAQQSEPVAPPAPVIVQPGAPGQPTQTLPPGTKGVLPAISAKDVEFMQGMIMHHAQAVEMTALINARTTNKELRLLGARISLSQSDEMNFMRRWLTLRGESLTLPASAKTDKADANHSSGEHSQHQMPGMLTKKQMDALAKAKGAEFDRLFLLGMIQHHDGALIMVKDLFDTAGAGQDAEIFNFATEVENGQRVEIRIMRNLLSGLPKEKK